MEKELAGKTAVVTGGSRGIGRAIAQHLSAMGASLVISYVNDQKGAEIVVQQLEQRGGRALAVRADMRNLNDIKNLFKKTLSTFDHLDILINNAGIANFKPIADFSEEEFDDIFNINVKGPFFCCQAAAKYMSDNGSIVNLGSTVTRVMLPNYGAYGATKGAINQITKSLAKELGPRGIRVNTLSPGPVDTELFRAGKTEEQIKQLGKLSALGGIGKPEDIAGLVGVLVSEQSYWVTGQNILANGGFAA